MDSKHSTMTGDLKSSSSSSARYHLVPRCSAPSGGSGPSGSASSSSSASVQLSKDAPSKKDDKDTKSTALAPVRRKSPAGEARPCDQKGNPLLPAVLEQLIHSYHADHFDVKEYREYTVDDCKSFTLFGRNATLAFHASMIATHVLHGRRIQALELARQCPESLVCITQARDAFGIGRLAEGCPVDLAAAAGNHGLTQELMDLVPEKLQSEAKRHLARRFPPGWEKETKDRMKQRYLDPAIHFVDQLEKAEKLSKDVTLEDAIRLRRPMIDEFRVAIRPRPDDVPITTGLMMDPQTYSDVDQLYVDRQERLGGWFSPESGLYWAVVYQSLQGAGTACIAHIIIRSSGNYFDAKVDRFQDGAPFFALDPSVGIGIQYVVSCSGDKFMVADAGAGRGWAGARWCVGFMRWLEVDRFLVLCGARTSMLPNGKNRISFR